MPKNEKIGLVVGWILCCILFLVGYTLTKDNIQPLGSQFFLAGLPIVTLAVLVHTIRNWRKKE